MACLLFTTPERSYMRIHRHDVDPLTRIGFGTRCVERFLTSMDVRWIKFLFTPARVAVAALLFRIGRLAELQIQEPRD